MNDFSGGRGAIVDDEFIGAEIEASACYTKLLSQWLAGCIHRIGDFINAFLCSVLVSASLTPLTSRPSDSSLIDSMLLVLNCICSGTKWL